MKKIILGLFTTLFIISLIWCLELYIKNGSINKTDVNIGVWYSVLNDIELPSLYDKFFSLLNVFKNNISNGFKYVNYSFKALGDSSSIIGFLKAYWNLWKSVYNLFIQPLVFFMNLSLSLFEWLYYVLLLIGRLLVFIFAPWLDYTISI